MIQQQEVTESLNDAGTALVALRAGTLTTEAATFEEHMKRGVLAFDVEPVPLIALDSGEAWFSRGIRRVGGGKFDGKQLGTVGPDYQIVQNTDVGRTLDAIMGPLGGIRLAQPTRGRAFDGGRVCSVFLNLPPALESLLSVRRDDSKRLARMVLRWSHDGSAALSAEIAVFRLLCENGMMIRHAVLHRPFKMKHTPQVEKLTEKMGKWLREAGGSLAEIGQATQRLDAKPLGAERVREIVGEVLSPEKREKESPQLKKKIDAVIEMVEARDGRFIPAGDVTAYTLLEAFTAYDNHLVPTRGETPEDRQARRELNVVSGLGVSGRAWEILNRI